MTEESLNGCSAEEAQSAEDFDFEEYAAFAQTELDALSVKREEALKELGEAAYKKFGAEQFPELAQRIGEIDSETERITVSVEKAKREDEERRAAEEARRAEEEAKLAARTCGHCGTVNPEGTNFCMACGRRISTLFQPCLS